MDNIEKLAIEHGILAPRRDSVLENIPSLKEARENRIRQLEAFAKALQSSEAVAQPYLYLRLKNGQPDWSEDCVSEDYSSLTENGSMDDGIYSALPLFTHPPATVPLEKYNKLLDALNRIANPAVINNYNDASIYRNIAQQAIVEAKGKEG